MSKTLHPSISSMSKSDMQAYIIQLEEQLNDQAQAEKLQRALFEIASIHHDSIDLYPFYQEIHSIIKKIIYAKNLVIAIYDEENKCLKISYMMDEKDEHKLGSEIPLGKGLSSYVIKSREAQLLDMEKITQLIDKGEIEGVIGSTDFTSWIGSPMISANILHGLIIIQSYDEDILYTAEDLELMNFVAKHIAIAIEEALNTIQRTESQVKMAKQHRLLESKNADLQQLIKQLKTTQNELLQKEKMASLGDMVAGVAHELNTPMGICVTAASLLRDQALNLEQDFFGGSLGKREFEEFIEISTNSTEIMLSNIGKASDLIESFKKVAVDVTSEERCSFNLYEYLMEVLLSINNVNRISHPVEINGDRDLIVESFPGTISQIISNLLVNSVIHAFSGGRKGNITISLSSHGEWVRLTYSDDGKGMDKKTVGRIFEPFFTTRPGVGTHGLGMHILYNQVTQTLGGSVSCTSEVERGTRFDLSFPKNVQKKHFDRC